MKKLFFMLIFCVLSVAATRAQILKVGLRGGANLSAYTFDAFTVGDRMVTQVSDPDSGYQIGLLMRLSIPGFIYIQPELTFITRDYTMGVAQQGYLPVYKTVRTERFELPVAFGIKLAALRLFCGPVFRLEAQQYAMGNDKDMKIVFNDNDVAAMAGFGLDFRHIFVDARCIKYLNKTSAELFLGGDTAKYNVNADEMWQFSFGFFF